MPDLARLAEILRDTARSVQEVADSYDERGDKREAAYYHWGKAAGYREAAEMVEAELEREERDGA